MSTNKSNHLPGRTGLFGGTFNPIHIGHRQVAMDVLTAHHLDCVYFIPSALPPHKKDEFLASAYDRLQMVHLAIGNSDRLLACAIEIERGGPSYSLDTVLSFKARLPVGGGLFFLVGIDAFLEIHAWKKFQSLFDHTAFIVMSRPPDGAATTAFIEKVRTYVQSRISRHYTLDADCRCLTHPEKQAIHLSSVTPIPIAASQLRRMARDNQPIDAWVVPAVADYIQQKGLYR